MEEQQETAGKRVEEPGICPRDGGKQTAEPVPAADERQHRPV